KFSPLADTPHRTPHPIYTKLHRRTSEEALCHRLHRRTSKNSSLCHRRSLLTIEEALCHRLQQTQTISETKPSHPSPSLQTRKPLKVKFSQILIQDMKRIRRGTTEEDSQG
ncbi:unnamed protein product, partial [Prunus brigantina]